MRFSIFAAFIAAPLALVAASNVLEVNTQTFENSIGDTPALVEFYATWCGHCKNLAPTYEKLADAFSGQKSKVKIVKIDADGDGREIGQKFGVQGFPTLKWFPKGVHSEPVEYEGGRDLEDLTKFITKQTGVKTGATPEASQKVVPPVTLQLEPSKFKSIALNKEKDVLVSFTATWCGHCKNLKPTFDLVSKDFENESNCVIANFDADSEAGRPISSDYGVSSYPTIKFFPRGDDKTPVDYNGARSEAAFVEFLNEKCGTHRAVGGGLTDLAGRVAALDSLALQFFTVPTSRAQIYEEAQTLGKTLGDSAAYYLRVMQKLVNGTDDYLEKETKRLTSILGKKTLAPRKLDEIKIKANILAAFVEQKVEDVSEKVAEHLKSEL